MIYDPSDSQSVMDALTGNLSRGQSALTALEAANSHLVASLGGGELSGRAYSAAQSFFQGKMAASLGDARGVLDRVRGDLEKYRSADASVSQYGALREDDLQAQIQACQSMKEATDGLIDTNRQVASTAGAALPALGAALTIANKGLEMISNGLAERVLKLQEKLEALRGFAAATAGLFQISTAGAVAGDGGGGVSRGLFAKSSAALDAAYLTMMLEGKTPEERATYLQSRAFRKWVSEHLDGAKSAMDAAADSGLIVKGSKEYARFLSSFWNQKAMLDAGIDPETWDTSLGTEHNWDTITRVYDYYGRLYLDDPDLEWAGMANMIGPSFAGGFKDLAMFRDIAQDAEPSPLLLPREALIARMSDKELAFFEKAFLDMQKEIFFDQARQHQAYVTGGMDEIQRLHDSGAIDLDTFNAWTEIASGTPAKVSAGNEYMLSREQNEIIHDDYDAMREHLGTGKAMMVALTLIGEASIPGAKSFPEVYSHGDISIDVQRWGLIAEDTLPAYQRLSAEEKAEIISQDFEERTQKSRIKNRLPEIAYRLRYGYTGDEAPPEAE